MSRDSRRSLSQSCRCWLSPRNRGNRWQNFLISTLQWSFGAWRAKLPCGELKTFRNCISAISIGVYIRFFWRLDSKPTSIEIVSENYPRDAPKSFSVVFATHPRFSQCAELTRLRIVEEAAAHYYNISWSQSCFRRFTTADTTARRPKTRLLRLLRLL